MVSSGKVFRFACLLAAMVAALVVAGCGGTKVENVDPTTEGYISGRWNDSDARAVADELIPQALSAPWMYSFRAKNEDTRPRLVVGDIENNTSEHINVDVFMNEMERVLINSGAIRFVADPDVRAALMEEVDWQSGMAKEGGVSGAVAEGVLGADLMLVGTISSIVDQADKKAIVFYQVDLTLYDLRNWEKVWIGQAQRKHLVEGAKTRF